MDDPIAQQIFEFETKAQSSVDPVMSWLASSLGYERSNESDFFYHLLLLTLSIYSLLTLLSSLARPDFLNLTILCLFILQLNDPSLLRRASFRLLTLLLLLSTLHDVYWALYFASEFYKEERLPEESSAEVYFKQNAVVFTAINIFWKILALLPTVWRVSLDYRKILKARR